MDIKNVTLDVVALEDKLASLATAERVTKSMLSELSRDLLALYQQSHDVTLINRLLGLNEDGTFVLTPMNWKTAVLYFIDFIPCENNYDAEANNRVPVVFGKVLGKKQRIKKNEAIADWLGQEFNDIWLWAESNIDLKKKPIDFADRIKQAIVKGMKEDDKGDGRSGGGLSVKDVFNVVLDSGITATDLLECLDVLAQQEEKVVEGEVGEAA